MAFPADKGTVRRLFCLFVCASLYFLTVDVLADVRVLELLGHDAVIPVHLMYLLFQCAGFLLFSVLDAAFCAKTSGRWPVISLFVISGASLMAFLLVPNATAVVAFVDVCLLTSGMIGAFAYYRIAIGMEGSDSLGQFCGFAIATAAVMQILVIVMPLPELGRAGLLLLALCAVSACVLADGDYPTLVSPPESLESQAAPGETTAPVLTPLAANAAALGTAPIGTPAPARTRAQMQAPGARHLIILLAIVAVMSFVGGLDDGVLTRLNAESAIDLYAFPRLFYLAGAIAAGFVADYREGRYLGLLVLASMLCSTVGLLFMDDPATMFLNACIYSLLAGFSIVFFTVPFMRLSVRTRKPALWASMGRAVRLPFLALGSATMEFALGAMPFGATIGLSAVLCAALFVLFFAGGFLSEPRATSNANPNDAGSGENAPTDLEAIALFAQSCGLTSREQEILVLLYHGCTTTEIADKLFISEKTVRNHISNTMAKAGVASRTELLVRALKDVR